ncbi:MAG: glycosyl hydrolase [Candidatus Sumerlaeaceae bacterium]
MIKTNLTTVLSAFRDPPVEYRSMPLWVWNGMMTRPRITEMLEQFAQQGMGGVFVHPRPGLITEYLSDEWFDLWGFALVECKRLGLLCNIYDENSYPAGFAGGHVPSRIPEAAAQYLDAVVVKEAPVRIEGELLRAYRLDAGGNVMAEVARDQIENAVRESPILLMQLRRVGGTSWTAGFPYVDLTRADVAREFIATTYEPYAAHFGREFGKTIRWMFCDEPMLGVGYGSPCRHPITMSREILAEFQREHGYDLLSRLHHLVIDSDSCEATRHDFYLTLQRLWTANFLKPLHDWCEAHNLQFTGHFMEHAWPEPFFQPSSMDGFRHFHVPGIDLLAPQFDYENPVNSGHYLMTVREVASAARQLGKPRVLCEAHGVGGWEATFEQFKQLADWLLVHGVNLISEHLSYQTICGARKYDHPQSFSDHSAWWNKYRPLADHMARLSYMLTRGERIARLLVLHPTTTGWLHANALDTTKLDQQREEYADFIQGLSDQQVDFDLCDELVLRDHCELLPEGKLRVGKATYDTLVIPPGSRTLMESTRRVLEILQRSGGTVYTFASSVAGAAAVPGVQFESLAELCAHLRQISPPLVTTATGAPLQPCIAHHARTFDGAVLHFLVNSSHTAYRASLRVTGSRLYCLDTFTGDLHELQVTTEDGHIITEITLPAIGHSLLLATTEAAGVSMPVQTESDVPVLAAQPLNWMQLSAEFMSAQRTAPNVLMLDYCDLEVNGATLSGLYVTEANRRVWQAHGFDQDAWDRSVQFRRNIVDRAFAADSGFVISYRGFTIDPEAFAAIRQAGPIELALERPDLYTITVNGKTIDFTSSRRWLDETIRAADITSLIQPGVNVVTLLAQPFNILCEIDRVYILGNFSTVPAPVGFSITASQAVALGDWTKQGLVMFDQSVRYDFAVELPESTTRLKLRLPQWRGSVVTVSLNGDERGQIAYPPYELEIAGPHAAGQNEITVEVVGTPKNLLGPHFATTPPAGRWTGPNAWDNAPSTPPPGSEYEIFPYGLMQAPVIYVGHRN